MAAYTGIQGQNILIVSSDPANPTEGQIWYNSTTNLLKGYANVVTNAWASGGNRTISVSYVGGTGAQTAALAFGGYTQPGGNESATELYNGTTWTANPTGLNTARYGSQGAGNQTASIMAGGIVTSTMQNATELWGGSSWTTSPATLNTSRGYMGMAGTQTATLAIAGRLQPAAGSTDSESWNGTSWTATPNLNTSGYGRAGAGIQTAALIIGNNFPVSGATESWNGSSWTTVNSLNTSRGQLAAFGTQTSALAAGGSIPGAPAYSSATELWNGTSWTTNPNSLATAREGPGGGGTQTSGLAFNGETSPGKTAVTEEWTGTAVAVRTITTS